MDSLRDNLVELGIEMGKKLSKTDFPNKDKNIPSYNTCLKRGIRLKSLNAVIENELYERDPSFCLSCHEKISFDKRMNSFCGHSCAASYSNVRRESFKKKCEHCDRKVKRKASLFCSQECHTEYKKDETIRKWLNGEISGVAGKAKQTKQFVRHYIYKTRGTGCCKCGWDEKHPVDGLPLTQIDHIDGDVDNTFPENLRVLCPNCHSKTPTYLNRNKKSTRNRRIE